MGASACVMLADVEQVAGGRTSRQEALAPGTSALQLSAGLQAVSSNVGRELEFHRADFAMMPGCSDACMEALLEVRSSLCYASRSHPIPKSRHSMSVGLVHAILLPPVRMHAKQ